MTLKSDTKCEEKLTLCSKNYMMNLVNFNASSGKSENLHFGEFILSKIYKALYEKVQKSYVSWHLGVIQTKDNSWKICFFCMMQ